MRDLSKVPEEYRRGVEIILEYEEHLSDGFGYYTPVDWYRPEEKEAMDELYEQVDRDETLAWLSLIVKRIKEEA